MELQALGYIGLRAGAGVADWADYGSRFLGLQLVDRCASNLTFRMDDRKQRLVVTAEDFGSHAFFGWEVADAGALNRLAARLERGGVAVKRLSSAVAGQRRVKEAIAFSDPVGIGWRSSTAPRSPAIRSAPAAPSPVSAPARSAWVMRC